MISTRLELLVRLLLPCLLLAAQSLALAHEFDHQQAGDGNSCVICPVSSNVEAAATDSGPVCSPESPRTEVLTRPEPICSDFRAVVTLARAPPFSL